MNAALELSGMCEDHILSMFPSIGPGSQAATWIRDEASAVNAVTCATNTSGCESMLMYSRCDCKLFRLHKLMN